MSNCLLPQCMVISYFCLLSAPNPKEELMESNSMKLFNGGLILEGYVGQFLPVDAGTKYFFLV